MCAGLPVRLSSVCSSASRLFPASVPGEKRPRWKVVGVEGAAEGAARQALGPNMWPSPGSCCPSPQPGLCLKLEVAPGPPLVPLLRPLPSCREALLLVRLGGESAWHTVIRRRCCCRGAPRGREGWAVGAQHRPGQTGVGGSSGRCPRDPKPSSAPFSAEAYVGRVLASYSEAESLGSHL